MRGRHNPLIQQYESGCKGCETRSNVDTSWHLRVSKAPSVMTVAISCLGGIRSRTSGSIACSAGARPQWHGFPMLSRRQQCRSCAVSHVAPLVRAFVANAPFMPPCLRDRRESRHTDCFLARPTPSPSPLTLIPLLSTNGCRRPSAPPWERLTFRGFLAPRQRAEVRHIPV